MLFLRLFVLTLSLSSAHAASSKVCADALARKSIFRVAGECFGFCDPAIIANTTLPKGFKLAEEGAWRKPRTSLEQEATIMARLRFDELAVGEFVTVKTQQGTVFSGEILAISLNTHQIALATTTGRHVVFNWDLLLPDQIQAGLVQAEFVSEDRNAVYDLVLSHSEGQARVSAKIPGFSRSGAPFVWPQGQGLPLPLYASQQATLAKKALHPEILYKRASTYTGEFLQAALSSIDPQATVTVIYTNEAQGRLRFETGTIKDIGLEPAATSQIQWIVLGEPRPALDGIGNEFFGALLPLEYQTLLADQHIEDGVLNGIGLDAFIHKRLLDWSEKQVNGNSAVDVIKLANAIEHLAFPKDLVMALLRRPEIGTHSNQIIQMFDKLNFDHEVLVLCERYPHLTETFEVALYINKETQLRWAHAPIQLERLRKTTSILRRRWGTDSRALELSGAMRTDAQLEEFRVLLNKDRPRVSWGGSRGTGRWGDMEDL